MSIRTFIGIPIGGDTANQLGDLAAKMAYQDKSHAVKWVDQANYHITLAFLGDCNLAELELLADALDDAIDQLTFEANIVELSPFPTGKPKLVAAMLEPDENLQVLHAQVQTALNVSNIVPDKSRFKPHVTLGRHRHSRNRYQGQYPMHINLTCELNEVVMYESVLQSSGAEYDAIFRFPLDNFYYQDSE